jgi:hypothetical protein
MRGVVPAPACVTLLWWGHTMTPTGLEILQFGGAFSRFCSGRLVMGCHRTHHPALMHVGMQVESA